MLTRSEKKEVFKQKSEDGKIMYYYALRRVMREQDLEKAYQIEMVGVVGGNVVKQGLLYKPDTLTMTLARMADITDPNNFEETENATNVISA